MESGFDKLLHGYEASLHFVMRHRFATFVASLALIAATAVLAAHMPTGFFPAMDGGRIRITTRAEESISFAALAEAQRSLHPIIAADPQYKAIFPPLAAERAEKRTPAISPSGSSRLRNAII